MSDIQWVNDKRVKPSFEQDMVNHPPHYKDASGVGCTEVVKHMMFFGFLSHLCGGEVYGSTEQRGSAGGSNTT